MNGKRRYLGPGSWFLPGLLGCLWLLCGCRGSPGPADAKAARTALERTLEAWKEGTTRTEFVKQSGIQTAESRWEAGYTLLEYRIAEGQVHGFDINFPVTLHLKDPKGKKVEEKATYAVATTPRVVVVLLEEM